MTFPAVGCLVSRLRKGLTGDCGDWRADGDKVPRSAPAAKGPPIYAAASCRPAQTRRINIQVVGWARIRQAAFEIKVRERESPSSKTAYNSHGYGLCFEPQTVERR